MIGRIRAAVAATVVAGAAAASAVGLAAAAGGGASPHATNPGFGYGYNCNAFGGYGYGYGFSTTPCAPKSSPSPSPIKSTVTVVPPRLKVVIKRTGHLHKGKQVVFDFTNIKPGAIDTFNQFKPVKNKTGHGYHFVKIHTYKIKAFTGGNIHYGIYLSFVGTGKTVVTLTDHYGDLHTYVLIYYVNP